MRKNANLHVSKRAKNDEFYTQITDVEKELKYYNQHFSDKIVLCNCNDALHTSFATYFSLMFESLGLKELICTTFTMEEGGHGEVYHYYGEKNENGVLDIKEWKHYTLEGNGGFNTQEGIDLIKYADIIVTNPPFSLFREFISILFEYEKKFLIIGNVNAITYKEIFPLIKENKMWLGISLNATKCSFIVNEDYEGKHVYYDNSVKYAQINNAVWFTNLDHKKRHEPLDFYKKYNSDEFPKYDNYDAINVKKVCDIPMDYNGIMGVPITFLNKYCPEQFEIIKFRKGDDNKDLSVNGKCPYFRILIKFISETNENRQ